MGGLNNKKLKKFTKIESHYCSYLLTIILNIKLDYIDIVYFSFSRPLIGIDYIYSGWLPYTAKLPKW